MKTRISETSIAAFLKSDRKTGCKRVYDALKLRGASTYTELVFYTGMKLPTVTGRVNELRYDYRLIVADGEKNGKTVYRLRKDGEDPDFRMLSKIESLIVDIEFLLMFETIEHSELREILNQYK